MKEVEHAVIVTNITGGATKFWIKTDRLFDEKSNDLFMYKFIFLNKNDVNWRRILFHIQTKVLSKLWKQDCRLRLI